MWEKIRALILRFRLKRVQTSSSFWTAIATVVIAATTVVYTHYARKQWEAMNAQLPQLKESADAAQEAAKAAQSAADTASDSLVLGQRPWIKIKVRMISPLTFNVGGRASGIPVAMMRVQNTIENVGQSVAENVLSWEDVIPMDTDHSTRTARARQKQWCDANRHPDPRGLSGYTLFPHDPMTEDAVVGPQMPKVIAAEIRDEPGLNGKVAFVLVGCVCYRSSFEKPTAPTHETRFMYYLGAPSPSEAGFQPYVFPRGVATGLQLIAMSDGFTAD